MFNIPWHALFLCVSLADYDLKEEDTMQGYMEECLECVQLLSHWSSCYRVNLIPVVVLLNCQNSEEKIKTVPLTEAFPEYSGPPGDSAAALECVTRQFQERKSPKSQDDIIVHQFPAF